MGQKSQHPTHRLRCIIAQQATPRRKRKETYNTDYAAGRWRWAQHRLRGRRWHRPQHHIHAKVETDVKHIHTAMVNACLNNRQYSRVVCNMPLQCRASQSSPTQPGVPCWFHIWTKSMGTDAHHHCSPFASRSHTLVHLHQHKPTAQDGGYHRTMCVETDVGPIHRKWGRQ